MLMFGLPKKVFYTDPANSMAIKQIPYSVLSSGLIIPQKHSSDGTLETNSKLTGRTVAIAGIKTVTVAGTPELLAIDQGCGEGVIIEAMSTNTGNIYIYPKDGLKTDAKPLLADDITVWSVSNLNSLKIDADNDGEGVYWKGAV